MVNIVEQLKSVVEDPEMFGQILGAGRTNHVGWLCVRVAVLGLVVGMLPWSLRFVRRHYEEARSVALRPGVTLGQLNSEERVWRRLVWVAAALLSLLLVVTATCDAVELYKYHEFPKAMVLRDVADKLNHY